MRPIRLSLKDVGRFSDFTVDLSGHLVGIVGENGAGKSTILSALYYAVTGDLGRLGRRQAVSVLRGNSTDTPYVRLEFLPTLTSTDPAVILRKLPIGNKEGTRRLVYGDRIWSAAADIDAQFDKWTGLSKKALGEVVFVAQGHLDEVVRAPATQRAEILHRAFGIEAAAKIHDACRDHILGLPAPPDQQTLVTLRTAAAEAEAAAVQAESNLAQLPLIDIRAEQAAQDLISRYQKAESARAIRVRAEAVVEGLREAEPQPPDSNRPDLSIVPIAEQLLVGWNTYRAADVAAKSAESRLTAARNTVNRLGLPDPAEPIPDPSDKLVELRSKKFALDAVVTCQTGDNCPVCSGPLTPDLADRTAAAAALVELKQLEREYATAIEAAKLKERTYLSQLQQFEAAERAVADAEASYKATSNVLGRIQPPTTPEADLKAAIVTARNDAAAWEAYDRSVQLWSQRLTTAQVKLEASPVVDPVSSVDADAAYLVVRHQSELRTAHAAASGRATALRQAAVTHLTAVRRAEAIVDAAAKTAMWRSRVEGVRSAFHRDAAPAVAANVCLLRLAEDLNRRLENLAARFRVSVNDAGEMKAEFRDGTRTKTVPTELLSGGEGVVLGLAWRLSLLDRYAPKVGLLCLDEPTTGLDAARVSALKSALEAWRPHGSDRQFVVVTHERKLMSAFDAVVDLGAG